MGVLFLLPIFTHYKSTILQFSFKLGALNFEYGRKAPTPETRSIADEMPEAYTPVDGAASYSLERPLGLEAHLEQIIGGMNGHQNLLTLAECVPEIYAPIKEIAVRVADAVWLLKRASNDNPIYTDKKFNDLFSSPNPTQSMKELIEEAVFYELLTGREFFYQLSPTATENLGDYYQNVAAWYNLPAQQVRVEYKKAFDLYSSTELSDIVEYFECDNKKYYPNRVLPIQGMNLRNKKQPLEGKPALRSAKKAIANLIAVYEARGVIYMKRGMLGLIVSKKTDESGTVALKANEKKQIRDEMNKDYGLTGGKDLVGVSNVDRGLP